MHSWLFSNRIINDFPPKESYKTCNKPIKLICIFTKFWIANIGNAYKNKQKKPPFVQWPFVNRQVRCAPLRNYLVLKKTTISSKILTYNPASFLCLPTDLFTKHCHIKWWCLGRNTANTPCTPTPLPPLRCGCLSWDESCLSKAIYITASIPDS